MLINLHFNLNFESFDIELFNLSYSNDKKLKCINKLLTKQILKHILT